MILLKFLEIWMEISIVTFSVGWLLANRLRMIFPDWWQRHILGPDVYSIDSRLKREDASQNPDYLNGVGPES